MDLNHPKVLIRQASPSNLGDGNQSGHGTAEKEPVCTVNLWSVSSNRRKSVVSNGTRKSRKNTNNLSRSLRLAVAT